MNIPFYHKENPSDLNCAPVCLRMALAYYGIDCSFKEIYAETFSFGPRHYTLPWGICLAGASHRLHVTFISKQPYSLLDQYICRMATEAGKTIEEMREIVGKLIRDCQNNVLIDLLPWQNQYASIPRKVVSDKIGVAIPTLWWRDADAHNVVLTDVGDHHFSYHDPNLETGQNQNMTTEEFSEFWLDPNTDNDLIILSNNKLPLDID